MKNRTLVILILSFNFIFSQNQDYNSVIVLDSKDPLLANYSVTKDSLRASISIYINGFQSKEKREKALMEIKKNNKRNDNKLPAFSINFLSNTKPEKLNSLHGIKYIFTKEFDVYNQIPNPTYFIVKQNNGTYLKWKTFLLAEE